jgi:hypothetical protein
MRPKRLFRQEQIAIINVSLSVIFLLSTMTLKAQTPTNFSGKWEFDKTKSKLSKIDISYDGTVILEITQNSTTITFGEIYIQPGSENWKTSTDSYTLDGKEQIKKDDLGTTKKSTKWSQDKKILTITNIETQTVEGVSNDYLVVDTHKLSDDGQTLTIESYSKNTVIGETTSKKVYHKK